MRAKSAAVMVFVFVTDFLLCRRRILQRDFFLLLLFPAMSTYQSLIVTKQRRTCEMMMMTMVSFFSGMAYSDGDFFFLPGLCQCSRRVMHGFGSLHKGQVAAC